MLNIDAAKSAALSITRLEGSNITTALPVVPQMAKTEVQIMGVYDLVYPLIHINYPTRDEVDLLIKQTLIAHHSTNWHLPISAVTSSPGSPIGMPGTTPAPPVSLIPKETIVKQVKVRAGSPVNSIGYGI